MLLIDIFQNNFIKPFIIQHLNLAYNGKQKTTG